MSFDRAYFEGQYRDYEHQNPARKLEYYSRLARIAVGEQSRPRILDVGCAYGLFLSHLDSNWEKYGEDASEYAIRRATERSPSIRFGVAVHGEHPFAGPFDVVTAWDVLEHVVELDELLMWICGNLAPGGALVFVVPVYDGPTGPVIRLLDRDPTHVHKRGRRFWLELASGSLRLMEWWGIYRFLLPGGPYLHFVTRSLRRYTPAIACIMRRR
ncbi:MAG TPA: class I SAM-dependent methyltransferase [Acidobacteriota bacterium]|nr:class I SAM-dependent methyltransferase [Acidobacteriota bacterium]